MLDPNEDDVVRDLITLPLRIGVSATRLGLRVARDAATAGLRASERLIEVAVPLPDEPRRAAEAGVAPSGVRVDVVVAPPPSIDTTPSAPSTAAGRRTAEAPSTASASAPPSAPPADTAAAEVEGAPQPAPAHVSEGLRFVEAFAEPGAEDGAGAAVHVEEPWKGYGRMNAEELIARLADATREELAAVELYEQAHRARRTVLAGADRQLRRATAAARDRK